MHRILKRGSIGIGLVGAIACGAAASYGVEKVYGQGTTDYVVKWIQDPAAIGACTPSSKYVIEEILKPLNVAHQPLRILEVGAGNGVCTRAITQHLKAEQFSLDVIEINPQFCTKLKKDFQKNPHVTIHQVDVTKWKPQGKYDVIISTLPLNLLDTHVTQQVLALFEQWIVPGGRLSYVEGAGSSTLTKIFMDTKARKSFDKKYKIITQFKQAHLEKTVSVLRNLPPYYVHHLKF